MYCDNKLIN